MVFSSICLPSILFLVLHSLYNHSFFISISTCPCSALKRNYFKVSSLLQLYGCWSASIWLLGSVNFLHFIIKCSMSSVSSWHSLHTVVLFSWRFRSSRGSVFVLAWNSITDAGVLYIGSSWIFFLLFLCISLGFIYFFHFSYSFRTYICAALSNTYYLPDRNKTVIPNYFNGDWEHKKEDHP